MGELIIMIATAVYLGLCSIGFFVAALRQKERNMRRAWLVASIYLLLMMVWCIYGAIAMPVLKGELVISKFFVLG